MWNLCYHCSICITALPKSSSQDQGPVMLSTALCSQFCQLLPKELLAYREKRDKERIRDRKRSWDALGNIAGYQDEHRLPRDLLYSRPQASLQGWLLFNVPLLIKCNKQITCTPSLHLENARPFLRYWCDNLGCILQFLNSGRIKWCINLENRKKKYKKK